MSFQRFCALAEQPINLPEIGGYWYVLTPYTKYPHGISRAFEDAVEVCQALLERGVNLFCPVAHSHHLAVQRNRLCPVDGAYWSGFNKPLLEASAGGILIRMRGWDESRGIDEELKYFDTTDKPVICFDVVYPAEVIDG